MSVDVNVLTDIFNMQTHGSQKFNELSADGCSRSHTMPSGHVRLVQDALPPLSTVNR